MENKEQIAFICTKSLINICKDLKEIGEPVLAGVCLFVAKTLTESAEKITEARQIHRTGGERAHDTIKAEITAVIKEVRKTP